MSRAASFREAFENIYQNAKWGDDGATLSGSGSTLEANSYRSRWLGEVMRKYNIKRVLDACGDCAWQSTIYGLEKVLYFGVDVSETALQRARKTNLDHKHMSFTKYPTDIERAVQIQDDPQDTLLILKEVLQHMPLSKAMKILRKAKAAGIRYAAITHHDRELFPGKNRDVEAGGFYPNNMTESPFLLPKAVESCDQNIPADKRAGYGNLYLFDLSRWTRTIKRRGGRRGRGGRRK